MECPVAKEGNSNRHNSKYLPLSGETFFLCLRGKRLNEEQLQQRIEFLGGRLEKFFSKEVTCVLTDEITNGKTVGGAVKGPKSAVEPKCVPKESSSQSKKRTFQRSSINEKAITWGKKLWRIDKFMMWLKTQEQRQKFVSVSTASRYFHKNVRPSRAKLPVCLGVKQEVVHLEQSFIKIENVNYLFRPYYKVFASEPVISFQILYPRSPFDDDKEQLSYIKRLRQIESRKCTSPGTTTKPRPVVKPAKPQRQYCECCNIYFQNLQQHLLGPKHSQFVKNSTNFDCITKILEDFESFEDDKPAAVGCDTSNNESSLFDLLVALEENDGVRNSKMQLSQKCSSPDFTPLCDELERMFSFDACSIAEDVRPTLTIKSETNDVVHDFNFPKESVGLLTNDPFLTCFNGSAAKRCSDVNTSSAFVTNLDFTSLQINLSSPEVFGITDPMFSDKSSEEDHDQDLQCFLNNIVKDNLMNEVPTTSQSCVDYKMLLPKISRPNESSCQTANAEHWPESFLQMPALEREENCRGQSTIPCQNLHTKYDWSIKYRSDTKIIILRTQKAISVR